VIVILDKRSSGGANGVPEKGMQPWGKTFSSSEIRNLSSFILSWQGTKPANAKGPQGKLLSALKN